MPSAAPVTVSVGADWSDIADGLDLLAEALGNLAYTLASTSEGLKVSAEQMRAKSGEPAA